MLKRGGRPQRPVAQQPCGRTRADEALKAYSKAMMEKVQPRGKNLGETIKMSKLEPSRSLKSVGLIGSGKSRNSLTRFA